jgi:hypothetical protein
MRREKAWPKSIAQSLDTSGTTMNTRNLPIALILIVVAALTAHAGVIPLGTAFTYHGLLKQSGQPANGSFHLRFQMWDALAGGSQVGTDLNFPDAAQNEQVGRVGFEPTSNRL